MKYRIIGRLLFGRRVPLVLLIGILILSLGAGLTTVFLGTLDRYQLLSGKNEEEGEFFILTKEVGIFNTLLNAPVKFSEEELKTIRSSEHFAEVGEFTPSMFRVEAKLDINYGMRTSLFLESVEAKYLESDLQDLSWEPGDKTIPLVISSDFVDLYNFGFSMAMGFPQINPSNIQNIPIELTISGKSKREVYKARVIGSTRRIQSILAPHSFIEWANENIAGAKNIKPSRIIVKVSDPGVDVKEFLEENKWETNQDSFRIDRMKVLGKWVLASFSVFCIVFGIVVFMLLLSNIRVSIFARIEEWKRLVEMGYQPAVFSNLILVFLLMISALSLILSLMFSGLFHAWIADQLWEARIFWPTGFRFSDLLYSFLFHLLILGSAYVILKLDQKKVV